MAIVGWLALAAGMTLLYAGVRGTSPLATVRAMLSGDPIPGTAYRIEGLTGAPSGGKRGEFASTAGGGGLALPLAGRITSRFGPRWGAMHLGVDIAAATGTPVRAAGSGRVTQAGGRVGYGLAVRIDHGGGLETVYAHLSAIHVDHDQVVSQGQTIGDVGSTGISTGPHLHFEVWRDGKAVDPLDATGGARV